MSELARKVSKFPKIFYFFIFIANMHGLWYNIQSYF